MPQTDEGEVRINAEMSVGTKLEVMDRTFREIERVVAAEVPEARKMLTSIGGGGWRASGQHSGDLRVTLAPKDERERSVDRDRRRPARSASRGCPESKVRAREGSGLFILNMAFGGGEEGLTVEVRGEDLEAGFELAEQVRAALQTIPVLTDVRIARDPGRPERVMRINRDKLAQLGLSMQQVAEVIETNLAGSRATVLREAGREVDIVVRLAEPDRDRLADIDQVSLVSAGGESVPLRTVVEVTVSRRAGDHRPRGPGAGDPGDRDARRRRGPGDGGRGGARRRCATCRCRTASRSSSAASTRSSRRPRASSSWPWRWRSSWSTW